MSDLEQLKKRKEQLLLEQEIAQLERKQQLSKSGDWNWWWVGLLAAAGAFLLIVGLGEKEVVPVVLSLFALAPVALKLYFKR